MIKKDKIKNLLLASTALALLGNASIAMAGTYTTDINNAGNNGTEINIATVNQWKDSPNTHAAPVDSSDLALDSDANGAYTLIVGKNFNINSLNIGTRDGSILRLDGANTTVTLGAVTANAAHASINFNGASQLLTLTDANTLSVINNIKFDTGAGSKVIFNGTTTYGGTFTVNTATGSIISINKNFAYDSSANGATTDFSTKPIAIEVTGEKFTHTLPATITLPNVSISSGATYEAKANGADSIVTLGSDITGAGTFTLNAAAKNITIAASTGNIGTNASTKIGALNINSTTAARTISITPKVYATSIATSTDANSAQTVTFTGAVTTDSLNLSGNKKASTYTLLDDSTITAITFGSFDDTVSIAASKTLTLGSITATGKGIILLPDNATLVGGTAGINKLQTAISTGKNLALTGNHAKIEFTNATAGTVSLSGTSSVAGIATKTNTQGTVALGGTTTVAGDIGTTLFGLNEIQIANNADVTLQPITGIVAKKLTFQGDASLTIDTTNSTADILWTVASTDFGGKNGSIEVTGKKSVDFTNSDTAPVPFANAAANSNVTVSLDNSASATLGRIGKSGDSTNIFDSLDVDSGTAVIKADSNIKTITLGKNGFVQITAPQDSAFAAQPVTLNVINANDGDGGIIFAADNTILGTGSAIGSATNGLGGFTIDSGDANTNAGITISPGFTIYAKSINAGVKSTITLGTGDYDFGALAIGTDSTSAPLGNLKFASDTTKVSLGNASITQVTTADKSTLELTGDTYNIGVQNSAATDKATVVFNNTTDIANLYARIGAATGNGPIDTLKLAGKNVTFADPTAPGAVASSLNVATIQFATDSVLTLPANFAFANVEVAQANIGTIVALDGTIVPGTQDPTLYLKEFRMGGTSAVAILDGVDTYSTFTTVQDGVASVDISGSGKVIGDIGSSSLAFDTVTTDPTAKRTFSGSVFARDFAVNGEVSFAAAQAAGNSLNTQTVTFFQDGQLTVENNSSINGAITASADGLGTLTFHGAGKDAISGIGTKDIKVGTVNIAKNGDTAASRSFTGDVYATNFNLTDSELKLSKDSNITADNLTLSGASISADTYVANLKGSNMKLSGVWKINSPTLRTNNQGVVIVDTDTVDYSALTAISADYLGLNSVPEHNQTFRLLSFAEGTKLDAATQQAIYKLINLDNIKGPRYVQYIPGADGVITAKVDLSGYHNDVAGAAPKEFAELIDQLARPAIESKMRNAIISRETTKVGSTVPVIAALNPSTTGNAVATTAANIFMNAADTLESLNDSNSVVVASGEYDDVRFGIVGQGIYGKSAAETTKIYRGHDAVTKGILAGVQVSTGNVNGSIIGIYSPTDLTYKTKLNYGTAINNKDVSISDTIHNDTVNALSIGGMASVVYGLQGGLYANAKLGYITTNIDDNTIRLNDLNDGQKVTSSSKTTSIIGRATVGYAVNVIEDVSLTPVFGLNVLSHNEGAYTEQGTGPAKLEVKASSSTTISGVVGAKLNGSTVLEDDFKLAGELRGNLVAPISSGKHTKSVAVVGASAVELPMTYASDSTRYDLGAQVTVSKDIFNVTLGGDMYFGQNTSAWAGFIRVGIDM